MLSFVNNLLARNPFLGRFFLGFLRVQCEVFKFRFFQVLAPAYVTPFYNSWHFSNNLKIRRFFVVLIVFLLVSTIAPLTVFQPFNNRFTLLLASPVLRLFHTAFVFRP